MLTRAIARGFIKTRLESCGVSVTENLLNISKAVAIATLAAGPQTCSVVTCQSRRSAWCDAVDTASDPDDPLQKSDPWIGARPRPHRESRDQTDLASSWDNYLPRCHPPFTPLHAHASEISTPIWESTQGFIDSQNATIAALTSELQALRLQIDADSWYGGDCACRQRGWHAQQANTDSAIGLAVKKMKVDIEQLTASLPQAVEASIFNENVFYSCDFSER